MARLNVDELIAPITPDEPCGANLEYDPDFAELERVSKRVPEQEFGDTKIPAVEPDWLTVRRLSLDLSARTKDLRVAVYLALAALRQDGLPGLRDALAVVRGLVENYWDSVYPQLDPDDDNDPTLRVNCLSTLADPGSLVMPLRLTPIVRSRKAGRFSRQDIGVVTGEFPAPEGAEGGEGEDEARANAGKLIDAAFDECDVEELRSDAVASTEAADLVRAIDTLMTRAVGAGRMRSLAPLAKELDAIHKILSDRLARRGVRLTEEPTPVSEAPAPAGTAATPTAAPAATGPVVMVQNWDADITCRDDAIKALERVCIYFEKYEPSSPLPLLLRRAKRLSTKSFLEILRDISPDGLGQAEALGGLQNE